MLAVAYREVPVKETYRKDDEKGLMLVGFLAFFDPPVTQAADILQALSRDGVEVKILTGDNELVARAHLLGGWVRCVSYSAGE